MIFALQQVRLGCYHMLRLKRILSVFPRAGLEYTYVKFLVYRNLTGCEQEENYEGQNN